MTKLNGTALIESVVAEAFPDGAWLDCAICGHRATATRAECARYLANGWPVHCGGETLRLTRIPSRATR